MLSVNKKVVVSCNLNDSLISTNENKQLFKYKTKYVTAPTCIYNMIVNYIYSEICQQILTFVGLAMELT